MPQNGLNMFRLEQLGSPTGDRPANMAGSARHLARHSLEANMLFGSDHNHDAMTSGSSSRPTSLQSSYSTNDLQTVKGSNGFNPAVTPPKTHADPFHQHNASLGRIPPNTLNGRQSRDSPERDEAKLQTTPTQHSRSLAASAAPFGPQLTSAAASPTSIASSAAQTPLTAFQTPFYGYGLQPYMGTPMQVNGQVPGYNPPAPYAGYAAYGNYRFPESPARGPTSRRNGEGESSGLSRFSNVPLEHYRGELYSLCKDQHGCRYLQRKLEERNPEYVQMIFNETHMHVVELMTGLSTPPPPPRRQSLGHGS